MSRLIDADVFEVVCFQGKSEEFCEGAKYILEMIDAQPTAYDVEKVVEELEEKLTCDDFGTCNYCQYRWCSRELLNADEAIEIVKKGGVE